MQSFSTWPGIHSLSESKFRNPLQTSFVQCAAVFDDWNSPESRASNLGSNHASHPFHVDLFCFTSGRYSYSPLKWIFTGRNVEGNHNFPNQLHNVAEVIVTLIYSFLVFCSSRDKTNFKMPLLLSVDTHTHPAFPGQIQSRTLLKMLLKASVPILS